MPPCQIFLICGWICSCRAHGNGGLTVISWKHLLIFLLVSFQLSHYDVSTAGGRLIKTKEKISTHILIKESSWCQHAQGGDTGQCEGGVGLWCQTPQFTMQGQLTGGGPIVIWVWGLGPEISLVIHNFVQGTPEREHDVGQDLLGLHLNKTQYGGTWAKWQQHCQYSKGEPSHLCQGFQASLTASFLPLQLSSFCYLTHCHLALVHWLSRLPASSLNYNPILCYPVSFEIRNKHSLYVLNQLLNLLPLKTKIEHSFYILKVRRGLVLLADFMAALRAIRAKCSLWDSLTSHCLWYLICIWLCYNNTMLILRLLTHVCSQTAWNTYIKGGTEGD